MKKLLVAVAVLVGLGLSVPSRASAHVFFGFSVPGVSLYVSPPSPFGYRTPAYYPPPAYYRPPRVVYGAPAYYYPPVPVYRPPCHQARGWGYHGRDDRDWDDD
jgi:hypothetical protein